MIHRVGRLSSHEPDPQRIASRSPGWSPLQPSQSAIQRPSSDLKVGYLPPQARKKECHRSRSKKRTLPNQQRRRRRSSRPRRRPRAKRGKIQARSLTKTGSILLEFSISERIHLHTRVPNNRKEMSKEPVLTRVLSTFLYDDLGVLSNFELGGFLPYSLLFPRLCYNKLSFFTESPGFSSPARGILHTYTLSLPLAGIFLVTRRRYGSGVNIY